MKLGNFRRDESLPKRKWRSLSLPPSRKRYSHANRRRQNVHAVSLRSPIHRRRQTNRSRQPPMGNRFSSLSLSLFGHSSTAIAAFHFLSLDFRQIPPPGKGSLYIRPLLIGSGSVLGLAPASEYTFLVYASPVGNYFKVCVHNSLLFLI